MKIKPKIYKIEKKVFVRFEFNECKQEHYNLIIKLNKKEIFNKRILMNDENLFEIESKMCINDILWFYYKSKDGNLVYITKMSIAQSDNIIDEEKISRTFIMNTKKKIVESIEELKNE